MISVIHRWNADSVAETHCIMGFVTFPRDLTFILRILQFCGLDRELFISHEFSYHKAFEAQKRIVTRCRGQHRQHSEPGQTLIEAGWE